MSEPWYPDGVTGNMLDEDGMDDPLDYDEGRCEDCGAGPMDECADECECSYCMAVLVPRDECYPAQCVLDAIEPDDIPF